MDTPLATELRVTGPNVSADSVERACQTATATGEHRTVAVAVDLKHSKQAADLLFGTGVGAVSRLDHRRGLRDQARRSVASGAAEVSVPLVSLDAIADLKAHLGAHTPLTVDITTSRGLDASVVELALGAGADFVSFCPDLGTDHGAVETHRLLSMASQLGRGGVKLVALDRQHDQLRSIVESHPWARNGGSRICLPALPGL